VADGILDEIVDEEVWRQVLASLVVCFFGRALYTPDVVRDALACAGIEADKDRLLHLGRDIYWRKWQFKLRHGFSPDALRIPQRICDTPSPLGKIDAEDLRALIEQFAARSRERAHDA
jgi:aldehyde:ferredoxin oxidoreductase